MAMMRMGIAFTLGLIISGPVLRALGDLLQGVYEGETGTVQVLLRIVGYLLVFAVAMTTGAIVAKAAGDLRELDEDE